jgi:hypothetical protein
MERAQMISTAGGMLIAISFTLVWVLMMLRPHILVRSMDEWRRVFGGVEHSSQVPLWLVRVIGAVLLVVTWFAALSSGAP